jgi:hypothetical protein
MGLVISKGLTLKSYNTPAAIAGVAPTLDYRFALDRREIEAISLTDKLTYTGATNGTFVNRSGLIERATTDLPRFDHGPASRQSLGLLVEEQRTNSIRNSTMVGAVAGTPGTAPTNWPVSGSANGITLEVVKTGTEDGIPYIDLKYSGTPTGGNNLSIVFEEGNTISASASQTWTLSAYVQLVGGSFANISPALSHLTLNAGGGVQNLTQALTTGGSNLNSSRQSYTATFSASMITHVLPRIRVGYTVGSPIDFTLRIGLPQQEQGAFATSAIPTTTTALTRPVDSAVIDGTGVITGTYTLVEKPAGCAVVSGTNIDLVSGFTAERVMVFPAALSAPQITAIRGAM